MTIELINIDCMEYMKTQLCECEPDFIEAQRIKMSCNMIIDIEESRLEQHGLVNYDPLND